MGRDRGSTNACDGRDGRREVPRPSAPPLRAVRDLLGTPCVVHVLSGPESPLLNGDPTGVESSLTIGEVVPPHPSEPLVEAQSSDLRPGRIELSEPHRQRLGVGRSEIVYHNGTESDALGKLTDQ